MPNTSDWDNADFLMDLGIALFTAAQANRALPVPVKEAVEDYLKERGWNTSFDAVRQHVQKLRKHRDTNGIQAAGTGSATTTTPRKKAAATPRKRGAGKNAAKNNVAEDDDAEDEKMKLKQENDDDDDEGDGLVSPSPVKRAKKTPKSEPEEEEIEGEI